MKVLPDEGPVRLAEHVAFWCFKIVITNLITYLCIFWLKLWIVNDSEPNGNV